MLLRHVISHCVFGIQYVKVYRPRVTDNSSGRVSYLVAEIHTATDYLFGPVRCVQSQRESCVCYTTESFPALVRRICRSLEPDRVCKKGIIDKSLSIDALISVGSTKSEPSRVRRDQPNTSRQMDGNDSHSVRLLVQ